MTLDEGHYYISFFVAVTYGKVSLWLRKSMENSRNFFSPTLWPSYVSESISELTVLWMVEARVKRMRRLMKKQ